jgi:hypothetical protein
MLRQCCHGRGTRITLWRVRSSLRRCFQRTNLCGVVLLTCYILPRYATLQDCFTVMSTWQHRRNILLRTCQECSAVTARPRYKIRKFEIKNTWFSTTFPALHFSIFCQITEFSYGPGLSGTMYILVYYICAFRAWCPLEYFADISKPTAWLEIWIQNFTLSKISNHELCN